MKLGNILNSFAYKNYAHAIIIFAFDLNDYNWNKTYFGTKVTKREWHVKCMFAYIPAFFCQSCRNMNEKSNTYAAIRNIVLDLYIVDVHINC